MGVLGDYAKAAPMETFIASNTPSHPTDLASLCGSRFVTATETTKGRRWDQSRILALTGEDRISARLMRCDFFEYLPTFKLFISGNHKPALRSVTPAIRRRFHLIPFAVRIPDSERDDDLKDKLRAEWAAILRWAVKGCLAWQKRGLNPPAAVVDATAAYLADEDTVARWVETNCELNPDHFSATAVLYRDWKTWAEEMGIFVGSDISFSEP